MDLLAERAAVDREPRPGVPAFSRGLPLKRTSTPQIVDADEQFGETRCELGAGLESERREPRAMLAVLPLELPVEPGIPRWPMQREDFVVIEHRAHERCGMRASAIESHDERSTVVFEVAAKRAGDERRIVVRTGRERGAIGHGAVRPDERKERAIPGREVHGIEAAQDTREADRDTTERRLALTLEGGERLVLDRRGGTAREPFDTVTERIGTDESVEPAHE